MENSQPEEMKFINLTFHTAKTAQFPNQEVCFSLAVQCGLMIDVNM